jgi:hypothetical protein
MTLKDQGFILLSTTVVGTGQNSVWVAVASTTPQGDYASFGLGRRTLPKNSSATSIPTLDEKPFFDFEGDYVQTVPTSLAEAAVKALAGEAANASKFQAEVNKAKAEERDQALKSMTAEQQAAAEALKAALANTPADVARIVWADHNVPR